MTGDPTLTPSTAKVTVPVRLPVPAPVVTVAVKLTFCPYPDGLMLEVNVVVVELTMVAIPNNSMSRGEFTVSPATSTLPVSGSDTTEGGNTTAREGANTAPIWQSPSTASKGGLTVQVVVPGSSAVLAPRVMAVRSSGAFPSFSTVWLSGADFSPWRTNVPSKFRATKLL